MTKIAYRIVIRSIVISTILVWLGFHPGWGQSAYPAGPLPFAGGWWEKEQWLFSSIHTEHQPAPSAHEENKVLPATIGASYWWLLVYQSFRDGNWEIYRGTVTEASGTRLTYDAAADRSPRLSPNADKIVFVSTRDQNNEIYLMHADGSNLMRLTRSNHDENAPAWSPDGSQLAYVSEQPGNADIYLMNADGSNQRALTQGQSEDFFPSWSPDGKRLVFVRAVNQEYGQLWVVDLSSNQATPLTSDLRYLGHPVWSPDGSTIAFDYDGTNDQFNELALIQADGSNLRQINRSGSQFQYEDYWMGSWSPDSRQLYFSHLIYDIRNDQLALIALKLCLGELVSTGCNQMSTGTELDFAPDSRSLDNWSPVSQINPLPPFTRQQALYISWRGYDVGPAGVTNVEAQYRSAENLEWITFNGFFQYPGNAGAALVNPPIGKLYFRSQAKDGTELVEAWPDSPTGDAATATFRWLLGGRLTDGRGVARPQQEIALQPSLPDKIFTDQHGAFLTHLPTTGQYLVNQHTLLAIKADQWRNFYTPPSVNLIRNGDFETRDLAHWQATTPDAVVTDYRSSGNAAVRLGTDCAVPCLAKSEMTPLSNRSMGYFSLLVGADQTLHLLAEQEQQTLFYTQRTPDGNWGTVVPVTNGEIMKSYAVLDSKGEVHVVWQQATANSNQQLRYSKRATDGSWSTPTIIATGRNPQLAVDATGGLHLLYLCQDCAEIDLRYRTRSTAGVWSEASKVANSSHTLYGTNDYRNYAVTVDLAGIVHVAWLQSTVTDREADLYYRMRLTNGQWLSAVHLNQPAGLAVFDPAGLQLMADQQGTLHLFWNDRQSGGYYLTRPPGSAWSVPMIILGEGQHFENNFPVMDSTGALHFLEIRNSESSYRYKQPGQPWSDPHPLTGNNEPLLGRRLVVGAANALYLTPSQSANEADILSIPQAAAPLTSTLSQALTIPLDLQQPTLSFLYTLVGGGGKANFVVDVTSALSQTLLSTQVFSATANAPWSLGWADLALWAGETVTVTFRLQQAVGEPLLSAYVDEITVGSWTTPLPQTISPARLEAGATTTFTITGQNFTATPRVILGGLLLTNVHLIDPMTLQADLTVGAAPGIHDLQIINPNGETALLQQAVQVGKLLYLPVIAK